MHRLMVLVIVLLSGCAKPAAVVRDPPAVEAYRSRITKVRHAIEETREVIAASAGDAHLPEMYMRLGELTSEEARYHYMVAFEREQGRAEALHLPQVRILKEQAIATYTRVIDRFPDSHLADRAMFSISQEYRELGEFDDMRATLERLIETYPDSPYRSEALLMLGDYHFDEGEFGPAERYYGQIVRLGRPELLGIANYKLAWVYMNKGDCKKAFPYFERAVDASQAAAAKGPPANKTIWVRSDAYDREFAVPSDITERDLATDYQSLDVRREALVDSTYCYAQVRKPEEAAGYLREKAANKGIYIAALSKMASRFAMIEQPRGAADVSRELLRAAPDDPARLDDARLLHRVVVRMEDYSQVGSDAELILSAIRRQSVNPGLGADERDLLVGEFEVLVRDLVTRAHRMHTEGGESEFTTDPTSVDETARAYAAWLEMYRGTGFELLMQQNLADLLFEGEHYVDAGHAYRRAAALLADSAVRAERGELVRQTPPEGEQGEQPDAPPVRTATEYRADRTEALYNAAVAYQRGLDSGDADTRVAQTTARAGLRAAGGSYLAEARPEVDRAKRVKFSIAQSYYDDGAYLQAIDLLTAVAYEYPGTEQGDAAVHLALDSFNTTNDIDGLIRVGRRFLAQGSPVAASVKSEIGPIVKAAERRRLDDLSLAASGDSAGGMEVLLAFADRYRDSDLGEEALVGTFVAARASGDADLLYTMGEEILARFPDSEQASGIASTIGQTAAARYDFDRALEYLTRASKLATDPRQGTALLLTVGELREELGDPTGALADYRRALGQAPDARTRADAGRHVAALVERQSRPQQVVSALAPLAEPFDPEVASRLGMALLRSGRPDEAEVYLRQVANSAAASPGARARAEYGLAEIMLSYLEDFEPMADLGAIEEVNGLVEIAIQSYLSTARAPDPVYAQAALARLARAAEVGAQQLDRFPLPPDLSAEDQGRLREALGQRAAALRAGRDDALGKCAQRARASYVLDAAGRACTAGTAPTADPVAFSTLSERRAKGPPPGIEQAQTRLSHDPDDAKALREVGKAFLDHDDPHAARLVLSHLARVGGNADDLTLLGRATYEAGDTLAAMAAYGRAVEAGSNEAARALAGIYRELGLHALADAMKPGGAG